MKMVIPAQIKVVPSSPHHAFSIKTTPPPNSSSSSLATSMKFKTLIHNCIFSHLFRVARAITKAKTIIMELLKEIHLNNVHFLEPLLKKNKNKNKLYLGSFRLHYNWCSSHVVPMTSPNPFNNGHVYYDSATWNSFFDEMAPESSQLSGYLHWLEEKNSSSSGGNNDHGKNGSGMTVDEMNEIDRLADKFIANCHEKFRLEKQESYRRFQEMMARSV